MVAFIVFVTMTVIVASPFPAITRAVDRGWVDVDRGRNVLHGRGYIDGLRRDGVDITDAAHQPWNTDGQRPQRVVARMRRGKGSSTQSCYEEGSD